VAIGRELTKAHEELVRGPISRLIDGLAEVRGEFTVVVDIGRMADSDARLPADDTEIADEFCVLTKHGGIRRREAIARVARRHGRTANEVYAAIERAKKLVE
jgi:16S rRNA (cytidine1402-2'-O)-methyltransferase